MPTRTRASMSPAIRTSSSLSARIPGPGHNSALVYMEAQIDYAVQAIRAMGRWNLKYLDVRENAQRSFDALQKRLAKTTGNSGCRSWYLTEDGFNATMYPGFATHTSNKWRTCGFRTTRPSPGGREAVRPRDEECAPELS